MSSLMNDARHSGPPRASVNNGSEGDVSGRSNHKWRSAATGHVAAPAGARAIRMVTPQRKGSVLDAGSERRIWVGLSMDGKNWMDERERWIKGLNLVPLGTVNSPQRRKPAQASFIAASNVACSIKDKSRSTAAIRCRMSSVMGSLGFRWSPNMRLMPRKMRWIVGDSVVEVGSPASV